MKGAITVFVIYLFCVPLFAQDTLFPSKQTTIGNRTHTNRDVLNDALVDTEQSLYLIGNTENDFTYNDIKIIKLNLNLDVVWEKTITFETKLSFDRVLSSYINKWDELIIVCKSAFNKFSETPIVVKIDKNGNLLWQLAFENLSDPKGMNTSSFFSKLDANEDLIIGFKQNDEKQENPFVLYKISPNGQVIDKKPIYELFGPKRYPISTISSNGTFHYTCIRDYDANNDSRTSYRFVRFNNEEVVSQNIELDEFETAVLSGNSEILFDNKNLPIWIDYPNQLMNGVIFTGFTVHYFDSNGVVTNYIKSDTDIRRYVLGRGFDADNNLMVISESVSQETLETLGLLMEKYSPEGELIDQILYNESVSGYQALIKEGQIVVQLENKSLNIYNTDFQFVKNIILDTGGAINYIPLFIYSIGNETIVAAQKEASMYQGSDFLGQRDFNIKKISQSGAIKDYTFSGNGTSKTWVNWIQNKGNDEYLIHITDKLGPDNLNIGGSRSKEYNYNYYYDSELNQQKVVENVTRVSWKDSTTDPVKTFDLDGRHYQYTYDDNSKSFTLSRDGINLWVRNWGASSGSTNYDFHINSKGDLYFKGSRNYGHSMDIVKLSMDGAFSHIVYPGGPIHVMEVLENDWIFTHTKNAMLIFSPDLMLISEKETYNNITYEQQNYTPSFPIGTKVLFSKRSTTDNNMQEMHIYDQYGNLENIYNFRGNLRERYAFLDGNDLVILSDDGFQIDHGFSWSVAVISKYENFVGDIIKNNSLEDSDGDGILNFYDYCEDTPLGNPVNEHGCNLFKIDNLNFAIKTIGETCFDKKDGQITITANQELNYRAILTNNEHGIFNENFNKGISFDMLPGGNYKLCITVEEISEFERCFEIFVKPVQQLYVESKISGKNSSVALTLQGSDSYTVQINDETFTTSSTSIDIPLKDPFNTIVVKTDRACQGIFEKNIILSSKGSAYPNPTADGIFHLYLGDNISRPIAYQVFSQEGRLMKEGEATPKYGTIQANIKNLPNGQYFCIINLNGSKVPYRIIKL